MTMVVPAPPTDPPKPKDGYSLWWIRATSWLGQHLNFKAKKESSDDGILTFGSDDEEYAMAVRNFKEFFIRKGKFVRCGDPNHLLGDCPKPPRNKDQKTFIGGSWSDSKNNAEDKTNDETCLMAQSSNEVYLRTCLELDEWIKDSGCSKHMAGNKSLFSTYKAYDRGSMYSTIKWDNRKKE
ncbi:hypothetical protein Tco_0626398 [Tanacetum coccineum]|uniref:Retrovirus-related Pol polyprotein from transposon TNT 1-94-like beta-barrel domain-containing protein n=1 Tax=Tanacetum coccineum TaxID=301880 RepID=A0ABQ4WJF6_9ASTR